MFFNVPGIQTLKSCLFRVKKFYACLNTTKPIFNSICPSHFAHIIFLIVVSNAENMKNIKEE
jgi:hypothetical protein